MGPDFPDGKPLAPSDVFTASSPCNLVSSNAADKDRSGFRSSPGYSIMGVSGPRNGRTKATNRMLILKVQNESLRGVVWSERWERIRQGAYLWQGRCLRRDSACAIDATSPWLRGGKAGSDDIGYRTRRTGSGIRPHCVEVGKMPPPPSPGPPIRGVVFTDYARRKRLGGHL